MAIKTGTNHYKMSKLQKEILLEFCNKSKITKTDLKNRLKREYPDIFDSVKILTEKECVEEIERRREKGDRGRKKVYYALTLKGIKEILELELGLEDFWRLIFHIVESDRFTSNYIKEIFVIYEKKYYKFFYDLITPLFDRIVSICNHIKKQQPEYDISIRILKMLASKKALTAKEITTKLDIPKSKLSRYYSKDEKNPGWINIMERVLLIENISKHNSKYMLTSVGTILLFDKLYVEIKDKTTNKNEIRILIENFKVNYKHHYPVIFENWDDLRKVIGYREMTSFFRVMLDFKSTYFSNERMQNGGLYEFFDTLQSMRTTYLRKLDKDIEMGRKVWLELSKEHLDPKKARSLLTDSLLRQYNIHSDKDLERWGLILDRIAELTIKAVQVDPKFTAKEGDSLPLLNEAFQIDKKKLENLVTLQFFAQIFYHIRIKQNVFEEIKKHHDEPDIRKEFEEKIDKQKEVWSSFLSNNSDYIKLFKQQIAQIVSYENENIKLIDRLGTLELKSPEMKEQDIDFLANFIK